MLKKRIAVIGSASDSLVLLQKKLAFDVGKTIIESGNRLINGGMGGVMEHSSRGAHAAANYQSGDVIGILPSYSADDANPYIDIPLPTGLGVARNAVLMSACDAVIALDGGSGTLSEIALAWQMGKTIACIGPEGWQHRLQSLSLDNRREDNIHILNDASDINFFINRLPSSNTSSYTGITREKKGYGAEINYLQANFSEIDDMNSLILLGSGKEGAVFTDEKYVYKVFHPTDYKALLASNLIALKKQLSTHPQLNTIVPKFDVFDRELLVIRYSYFDSRPYSGGSLSLFSSLLRKIKNAGWCLSNIKAENFRLTTNNSLMYVDIGRDIVPFTPSIFYSSCQRAFLTARFNSHSKLKDFYRYTNDRDDFNLIANSTGIIDSQKQLFADFSSFYKEVLIEH